MGVSASTKCKHDLEIQETRQIKITHHYFLKEKNIDIEAQKIVLEKEVQQRQLDLQEREIALQEFEASLRALVTKLLTSHLSLIKALQPKNHQGHFAKNPLPLRIHFHHSLKPYNSKIKPGHYIQMLEKLVHLLGIFPNASLILSMIRKVRIVHTNLDLFLQENPQNTGCWRKPKRLWVLIF